MKKVLLVDDLPANLYLLQVLLTHHGFHVETATDGAQALARARQSPPDLIVTDILMPVMDGFTLCRQWKTDTQLKHIPLVFYTATYTDARDEQFALNLGADAFLVKPAEPDDFMARITAVLAVGSAASAAPQAARQEEQVLLKEYNQVLVHKLEQKLKQLEDAERFNRTLFEHSPIGLALCRMDGTLLDVNPAYARILGRSVPETLGLSYWQITPERYARQEARQLEALQSLGRYGPYEKEYVHADGHLVPVHLSGCIVERDGERLIWSSVQDISERKRAELALCQSEERFRLAAAGGDVWGWDIGTNQFSLSTEFWRTLGYQEGDVGESLLMFESVLHPDDRARWRQAVKEHVSRHLPYDLDLRLRSKSGEYRWLHTSGQARWDEAGRATYMAGTTFDISERKRAEAKILQLNAELEQRVAQRTAQLAAANRELEAFAYSVSHDLKAPLRGIDGYSQLLQETCAAELSAEARLFVGNIRQGAAQMSALIDDLLAYSRMERRPLHSTALNLADVVQAVLAERATVIETRGAQMHVKLPTLTVQADLDGLAIVLRNLLENALKFTRDSKPPEIAIGGREEQTSCVLWIQDNGIGFDMKFHERIFEIFQRLQRAEDYPGTGIGLALVSKAIQRMGGRVWAQSAPGQGATFFLELPK